MKVTGTGFRATQVAGVISSDVKRLADGCSVFDCSNNADRTQGVEPVGVLNDLAFVREFFRRFVLAKRKVVNDVCDVIDRRLLHPLVGQNFARELCAAFLAIMKFCIADIVKQCGKFDDQAVAANLLLNVTRGSMDSPDMVDSVTGLLVSHALTHNVGNTTNDCF